LIGLPLAAALLAGIHYSPLKHTVAARYVSHPAQWAVVCMFCTALGALFLKLWHTRSEFEVCELDLLPRWDGNPISASDAPSLLSALHKLPGRLHDTLLARRMTNVVSFVCQRRSAADLDDQMRALADTDAVEQESGFALIRFITWAIPILGFLGTVLGITAAIAGINPEMLDETLAPLTDGLAEAFDSTALALGLTMIAMFFTFLVDKQEQAVLGLVDRIVDRQLAHRFQREGVQTGPFVEVVREHTRALVRSVEGLVQKQAELWAHALAEPDRRVNEAHARTLEQLTQALRLVLEQTLQSHAQRLGEMEKQTAHANGQLVQQLAAVASTVRETGQEQQATLVRVADSVAGQAAVLGQLQQDAANLVHLQAVLHQNLSALAGASAFEQAVHTLTAAVHLLTARAAAANGPQLALHTDRAAA
jgi:biopolymer transport protein ExbB/TolQ